MTGGSLDIVKADGKGWLVQHLPVGQDGKFIAHVFLARTAALRHIENVMQEMEDDVRAREVTSDRRSVPMSEQQGGDNT